MNSHTFESTYAMVVRSEKERSGAETLVYSLLIAAMFFTGAQVATMPVRIPHNLSAPTMAQQAQPADCMTTC